MSPKRAEMVIRNPCTAGDYSEKGSGLIMDVPLICPIQTQMGSAVGRFWSKVDRRDATSCWPWIGARLPNGRGQFFVGSKAGKSIRRYAYAVSWELANSRPIPAGLNVLHSCDNPNCVNPAHLSVGTQADNIADAVAKGRYTAWHRTGVRLDGRQALRQPLDLASQGDQPLQLFRSHAPKSRASHPSSVSPQMGQGVR